MDKLRDKVIKEADGLTRLEKEIYKKSFDNEIRLLRLRGLLGENDLPTDRQIDEWKISMDKMMITKLCKSVHKRIFNYKRKIFGMSSIASDSMVSYFLNEMMKELIEIRYSDLSARDMFFGLNNGVTNG